MFAYMRAVRRYGKDDTGASAVEYGLLVAAIAAVIVVIVFALGSVVKSAGKLENGRLSALGTLLKSTHGACLRA